jgi:hypothetical protein
MKILDEQLGPLVRQYVYYFLLKEENKNIWYGLCTDKMFGTFWKFNWNCGLGYLLTNRMRDTFAASDITEFQKCKQKLK